jgi:hypothetical protein
LFLYVPWSMPTQYRTAKNAKIANNRQVGKATGAHANRVSECAPTHSQYPFSMYFSVLALLAFLAVRLSAT